MVFTSICRFALVSTISIALTALIIEAPAKADDESVQVVNRTLGELILRASAPAREFLAGTEAWLAKFAKVSAVSFIHVDTKALINNATFEIRVNGKVIVVRRTAVENRGSGDYTWFGEVIGSSNSSVIVVRGNQIDGQIDTGSEVISLRESGIPSIQVVAVLDSSRISSVEGANVLRAQEVRESPLPTTISITVPKFEKQFAEYELRKSAEEEFSSIVALNRVQPSLIVPVATGTFNPSQAEVVAEKILVAYSAEVARAHPSVLLHIQAAIDDTNAAYKISQINVKLALASELQVTFSETGSLDADLLKLASDHAIACAEAASGADVVVLFVLDNVTAKEEDACGDSSSIPATAQSAYAVVNYDCAVSNHSFAHEVAHLQGARHDLNHDNGQPYPYGHGFTDPNDHWRDIMGYPCPDHTCDYRSQTFANPDILVKGYPGGDASTSDVARVINEMAATTATLHTLFKPTVACAP